MPLVAEQPYRTGQGRARRVRTAVVWFLALGLVTGCGAQNYADSAPACQTPDQAERLADELFRLINMQRTLEDLDPLAWDDELAKVSESYACRMIEGEFFGHLDPETKTGPDNRLTMAGYEFDVMGENLAVGQTTAVEVLDGWMASPSHRDNILSSEWMRIGIGIRTDQDGVVHWVLEFADPA